MKNFWIIAAVVILGFANCHRDELFINSAEDFDSLILDEMESQHIPALAALIFKGEEILYEKYFGNAHIGRQIALESDHLFLLASISKTVTAVALLQLVEHGHCALDDPINDYLPFEVMVPNHEQPITFQMLLTHTSGIADGDALDDQYYYNEDSPLPLAQYLENYLVPGGTYYHKTQNYFDFEPGSRFEYSNEGSALIGLLVEEISGVPFDTYCMNHIFEPLGMADTYWRLGEISGTIVQPYQFERNAFKELAHYTFTDYPNGGLRSTVRDMFHFLAALAQKGEFQGDKILQPETVVNILTPQIPILDPEVGLHFFLMNKEKSLWGHDGGEEGVSTIMAFNPSDQIGALIFTNQSDVDLDELLGASYDLGTKL